MNTGDVATDSNTDAATDSPPMIPVADIAPGAVVDLPVTEGATGVRLATPNGNEQFVVVLASTLLDGTIDPQTYSISASAPMQYATATPATGCSLTSDRWRSMQLTPETEPTGTAATMGTQRTIQMQIGTTVATITVEVVAVGTRAVVWADVTAAHPANLDPAFVTAFLADFENTILPRERQVFGMESDQDHDGHISLVFSPLTYRSAVAYFTGCDLANFSGCRANNHGEYLYLTPPATIDPPYNTPAAIKEILAHECSHLVHFNRKVLRNGLTDWPDNAYIVEGTGALGQDTIGFQAGNLYVTMAGLDGIDDFTLGEVLPDHGVYDMSSDGVLRGGAYLFTRWLYDRAGGDEAAATGADITNMGGPAFLHSVLDAHDSVITVLPTMTGANAPIEDIAMDFYTTLAMSNREDIGGVAPTNACFAYLPQVMDPVTMRPRGANVYASFHGMMMNGPATQPLDQADGSLLAGGVEYIVVDAQAGQPTLDLSLSVATSAMARVRIGRVR
jgi:hypothetical protein